MTHMLSRNRAELIVAEAASGKPIRAIARAYGHSQTTVRDYARGRRLPGEEARADGFEPFAAYCRQRLADDPHLRAPVLRSEVSSLGLDISRATFYRALERHGLRAHPCPGCRPAGINANTKLAPHGHLRPAPLPMPTAPVAGETLASFLGRLAAANRTSPDALLETLPPWFRLRTRRHDDRWQNEQLTPWAGQAARWLAVTSGTTPAGILNALPAFGILSRQAARAISACRRCTTARGIPQPVPVHLPAHYQVCLKHGTWLSGPEAPQFSVSECPDIIAAERQARRLGGHTTEQLIYAKVQAAREPSEPGSPARERRLQALIESSPPAVTEASLEELLLAVAYPEAIADAVTSLQANREGTA